MHLATSQQGTVSLGFGSHTCTWGTHLCALYESEAELEELRCAVAHAGDLDGALQILAEPSPSPERFERSYAARFPDRRESVRDPARFRFEPTARVYHPDGRFSIEGMSRSWAGLCRSAAETGRPVRFTADMSWALAEVPGRELLVPYEAKLDDYLFDKPFLTICAYDLRRFSGATVMGILHTHRFTIARGMVIENPYYDPHGWLARNAPGLPPLGA